MSSAAVDKPRYLPNDGTFLTFDPSTEIPRHASLLVTRFPPVLSSFNKDEDCLGFYSGPTSIALALFHLRNDLPSSIEGKSPTEWAKEYLQVGKELLATHEPGSFLTTAGVESCGLICTPICWAVLAAGIYEDESYLEPLFQPAPAIIASKEMPDEWLIGRGGYLYSLRLARSYFPSLATKIDPIVAQVIEAMLVHAPLTAEPWSYAGNYYFGLGHGWIGNLTFILLADPTPTRAKQLRPMFLDVIRQQLPDGNFMVFSDLHVVNPEKPKQNRDVFMQISHGGPGFVISFMSIRHLYEDDPEFLEALDGAINKAQECIWQRGLLTKESCLLHGAAGNSLALLDKRQKETFLAVSTQEKVDEANTSGKVEPSNSGSGLSRGLAGRIWAMVEFQKGRNGMFLSYNVV